MPSKCAICGKDTMFLVTTYKYGSTFDEIAHKSDWARPYCLDHYTPHQQKKVLPDKTGGCWFEKKGQFGARELTNTQWKKNHR